MKLTEAHTIARFIDTQKGFDKLVDMVVENDDYEIMREINVAVGRAIDEVAKKHGIPFSLDAFYRHEPFSEKD